MKKGKTQGIGIETKTKDGDSNNTNTSETELLDLRAGFVQHTSPYKTKRSEKAVISF
jgi:hypothetical protein